MADGMFCFAMAVVVLAALSIGAAFLIDWLETHPRGGAE